LKKSFAFISYLVISALVFSAAPVLSSSEKKRDTSSDSVRLAGAQQPPVVAGQLIDSPRQDPELSRRLRKYDLVRMDPGVAAAQVRTGGKLALKTSQENFELEFTPIDLRAPDYVAQVIGADGVARKLPETPVNTFKGTVKGSERAQARMTITDRGVEGAIITDNNRYFLQPARDLSNNAKDDEFVVYEASALTDEGATCGVTLAKEVAARAELAAANTKTGLAELNSPVPPISPMKLARLATDADGEYVAALGGAVPANNQIMSIMNMVDGIYQVEIGVTFQIVFQNAWPDAATDPYLSTVAGTRLEQFENRWNTDPMFQSITRSLAHLWTGVNVTDEDGNPGVIGVAEPGVVCRFPEAAYGLSQRFTGNSIVSETVVLTAHEIGHNFSAFHPDVADEFVPPDVERACENTIMGSFIGDGSAFCAFSRSEIIGFANKFSTCLSNAASGPPALPTCVETPIDATGLTANGTLSNGDCRSTFRGVNHFADQYSFNGIAGQRVSITMVLSSGTIDPYLYLIGPDGYPVSQDDDGNGNLDSRIPSSLGTTIALPMTGKYILEATSFEGQQTGNYTITVTQSDCRLSVSPTSQHFPAAGGNGSVTVTASGSCTPYDFIRTPDTALWLTPQTSVGSGSQSLPFTVGANTGSAGRRGFLVVGPSPSPDFSAGISIPITQSGTAPDCSVTPIAFGQTINGTLATGDCHSPIRGNGFLADRYTFNASAGQSIVISASSASVDTFLNLMGPNGFVLIRDDDSGEGGTTNSRIPGGTGALTLGTTGTYTIEITAFSTTESGAYALTLTGIPGGGGAIQFLQPTFSIVESQASMNVMVTRTGDASGTATVDYATSDTAGTQTCPTVNGQASSRCDYITTLGTLTFAAGETSKTIPVPIVDDVHNEGSENFTMTLSNVKGATLGTPSTAMLTITESEAGGTNPSDNASFFARQHYLDFLNREPDAGGLAFWSGEITSCGADAQCIEVKRINVSAAFFLSIEFQETGYLVYRTYKSAFGNLTGKPVPVRFTDFLRDTQRIGQGVQVGLGNWQVQLEVNKQLFMQDYMLRSDFQAAYPNSMTAAQFVDQLNANAGGALSPTERNNLIATLTVPSDVWQRAAVLRAVAEDQTLRDGETNRAFVLMQYFGYLRRNPDDVGFDGNPDPNFNGFNFWLDKLNQFNGNFIAAEMVKAFITSIEYRQRFGQ